MPGPKNRNPDHLIPSGSLLGLARELSLIPIEGRPRYGASQHVPPGLLGQVLGFLLHGSNWTSDAPFGEFPKRC